MQFADVKNDIAFRKIFGNENRKETPIEKIAKLSKMTVKEVSEIIERHTNK